MTPSHRQVRDTRCMHRITMSSPVINATVRTLRRIEQVNGEAMPELERGFPDRRALRGWTLVSSASRTAQPAKSRAPFDLRTGGFSLTRIRIVAKRFRMTASAKASCGSRTLTPGA
jgi:hypothetical protein